MFSITPAALDKLNELREDPSHTLLVSIIGSGCSGLSYQMKWQDYEIPYDKQIFVFGNLVVGTDNKSAFFLEDVTLDYEGGLNGKGFVWDKPSAKRVCGCGSSFST